MKNQSSGHAFTRAQRLVSSAEFLRVKKTGQKRIGSHAVVWIAVGTQSVSRLGLAVARQAGKAHDRNLFKRRLREIFRKTAWKRAVDVVVAPRGSVVTTSFEQICADWRVCLANELAVSNLQANAPVTNKPNKKQPDPSSGVGTNR